MHRVRIGLTGLACVFVLVLIGAASIGGRAPAAKAPPEEPLAQLGVAPGSGDAAATRAAPVVTHDTSRQIVAIQAPPAPILDH